MSTEILSQSTSSISETAYYAATGFFFGVAVLAATARAYIRIYHLKRIHADDYLFFVATSTLIAGSALFYVFIGNYFLLGAISEGRALPPSDLMQKITDGATYALIAELLCWTTIFSVKFSFLLYFRALVNRLPRVEVWWWIILVVFIPITAIMIPGTFIVCPHTGPSVLLHCSSSPGFLRREHIFLYFTVASDIVTDIMLISIPVIVLRKASFNLGRKLSIAVVLCMSLLMIAIALVRGVSAGVLGTEDQAWNSFWVQLEASVSVIAACPTAFRSLFLVTRSSKHTPEQRSVRQRLWKRTRPNLQSIHVGATLTGMRTVIGGDGDTTLESHDDGCFALGRIPSHTLQSTPAPESPKPSVGRTHEPVHARTMV